MEETRTFQNQRILKGTTTKPLYDPLPPYGEG